MMKNLSLFILLLLIMLPSTDLNAEITKMTRKGRWIEVNDRYPYIVGIDLQRIASWTNIDYVKTLNEIQKSKINYIRIWVEPVYLDPENAVNNHIFPYPFSDGKFEFNRWNSDYWQRLKRIIREAQTRDIIVCLSIFNVLLAQFDSFKSPFDKNWNHNTYFSAKAGRDLHPEWYDLNYKENNTSVHYYQKLLLDKTLLETDSYPNVIYEIQNENGFHANSISQANSWQNCWALYAKTNTSRLIKVHAHYQSTAHIKGVNDYVDKEFVDILNFHFYSGNPDVISNLLHGIQNAGKIIFDNEGFSTRKADASLDIDGFNKAMRNNWGLLTSGGYGAIFNLSRHDDKIGDETWKKIARRLQVQREIAELVPFYKMSAVDTNSNECDSLVIQGPAKHWQVYANIGRDYLIYFWDQKREVQLKILLPRGNYQFQFQDVRDGKVLLHGLLNHKSNKASFNSPIKELWDKNAGLSLIIHNTDYDTLLKRQKVYE